jgi:hypothetical protein
MNAFAKKDSAKPKTIALVILIVSLYSTYLGLLRRWLSIWRNKWVLDLQRLVQEQERHLQKHIRLISLRLRVGLLHVQWHMFR